MHAPSRHAGALRPIRFISKLDCRMGLATDRMGLYSAFRQLYLASADFCEIRPYFVCGNGAGERRNGAPFDLLPASFWPFFHFGNEALFLPFVSPISIMGELIRPGAYQNGAGKRLNDKRWRSNLRRMGLISSFRQELACSEGVQVSANLNTRGKTSKGNLFPADLQARGTPSRPSDCRVAFISRGQPQEVASVSSDASAVRWWHMLSTLITNRQSMTRTGVLSLCRPVCSLQAP
jgi:hypothetical protein